MVYGLRFRDGGFLEGLGLKGFGFEVEGRAFRAEGLRSWFWGSEFRVQDFGVRV